MLSGIGPRDELQKLSIDVIQELSVGKNLQDHPTIDGFLIKLDAKHQKTDSLDQIKNDSLEYLKTHDNLISSMGTLSSGCFVRTTHEEIPDYPDVQFAFDGINITVRVSINFQTNHCISSLEKCVYILTKRSW